MSLTKEEIAKIKTLIRTKDLANLRIARQLCGDEEPEEVVKVVCEAFRIEKTDGGRFKVRDLDDIVVEALRLFWSRDLCLDLSENELTQLPKSIGQLVHLEELDLSENKLTKLPASIGQLVNLEELYLASNLIPTTEIDRLRKLLPAGCKIITD